MYKVKGNLTGKKNRKSERKAYQSTIRGRKRHMQSIRCMIRGKR